MDSLRIKRSSKNNDLMEKKKCLSFQLNFFFIKHYGLQNMEIKSKGLMSACTARPALCKVIYLCRVCCVSIKSGARLSKLELNEKFFVW